MDKRLERAAASAVFGSAEVHALEDSERPDLIATMATGARVGIEVTEAFITESDARLQRIPGYGLSLLDGGRFKHRDDKTQVPIGTVQFPRRDAAGKAKSARAVFSLAPSLADHFDKIADCVVDKNVKHANYREDVDIHDLIVIDRISGGPRPGQEVAASEILTRRLSLALQRSPYGEVYLLSITDPGGPSVIPLKSLMLHNTSNIAAEAVFGIIDTYALRGHAAMRVWMRALRAAGVPVDLLEAGESLTLAWGSVRLDCESREEFRIFHDYSSSAPRLRDPEWPISVDESVGAMLEAAVVERIRNATTVSDFSSRDVGSKRELAEALRSPVAQLTIFLDMIELEETSDGA